MKTSLRLSKILEILQQNYSQEKPTELYYTNNYTLLLAVLLSAQATDIGVNRVTPALFAAAATPRKILALGQHRLQQYIRSINYYRTKAKHILCLSRQLQKQFHSQVPNRLEDLISLVGVGRKTANVVLNVAFGQPTLAVDTHVFRVSHRLDLATASTPAETEKQLLQLIPPLQARHVNNNFVRFGRDYCKARNPRCFSCPLKLYCHYSH
jgi:endonuclease-3